MAGTLVTPARKLLYIEGARFRSANSEELIQRISAIANFIALYVHSEKQFSVNGRISGLSAPFLGVDGYTFAETNMDVFDAWMFLQPSTVGFAGTLELDIKASPAPGSPFVSIFTTTPKIQAAALSANPEGVWINVGAVIANTTAPVLSATPVPAGSAMRLDILQNMSGLVQTGCGIVLHYRPTD